MAFLVAYVVLFLAACMATAPMFMAGVAYAQGATLWGVYPVLALGWFFMFSDWLSGKIGDGRDDDEHEEND